MEGVDVVVIMKSSEPTIFHRGDGDYNYDTHICLCRIDAYCVEFVWMERLHGALVST